MSLLMRRELSIFGPSVSVQFHFRMLAAELVRRLAAITVN